MLCHYNSAIRFLSCSYTHYIISFLYRIDTFSKEYIGLTVFRIINNTSTLGAIYEPRVFVHLLKEE